jgi:hypothetical protein
MLARPVVFLQFERLKPVEFHVIVKARDYKLGTNSMHGGGGRWQAQCYMYLEVLGIPLEYMYVP